MPTWRIHVFGFVVIVMVISFGYLRLRTSQAVPEPAAMERTEITDVDILEKVNPAFYRSAENGDVVLRYEHRLDLYRPSENRVIKSAPIAQ